MNTVSASMQSKGFIFHHAYLGGLQFELDLPWVEFETEFYQLDNKLYFNLILLLFIKFIEFFTDVIPPYCTCLELHSIKLGDL